jgi:hypothetical protein
MAARSTFSRAILFILGLCGIAAGVIFLLGMRHFKTRMSEILLGVGGVCGGLAMVKIAMTPDQPTIVNRY